MVKPISHSRPKQDRQRALLRLVREQRLTDQRGVLHALSEVGFPTTQASISRDLRELGLVKVAGRYRRVEDLSQAPGASGGGEPAFHMIRRIHPVGANLIVLHTGVGEAGTVAAAIDRRAAGEIVGTIAGDDTIFLAVRSRSEQGWVVGLLKKLMTGT